MLSENQKQHEKDNEFGIFFLAQEKVAIQQLILKT